MRIRLAGLAAGPENLAWMGMKPDDISASLPGPAEVTRLLEAVNGGDRAAAADLLPLVYEELRKLARSRMNGERAEHTLQATALVHEAYMRLIGVEDVPRWDGRGHFFAAAAEAMRRILIDRARQRASLKRGGDRGRVQLSDEPATMLQNPEDVLAVDEAIKKLEARDARKAQVVVLRFFAGLSIEETAAAMGLSLSTVKNEWSFARAWLHRELSGEGGGRAASML